MNIREVYKDRFILNERWILTGAKAKLFHNCETLPLGKGPGPTIEIPEGDDEVCRYCLEKVPGEIKLIALLWRG